MIRTCLGCLGHHVVIKVPSAWVLHPAIAPYHPSEGSYVLCQECKGSGLQVFNGLAWKPAHGAHITV